MRESHILLSLRFHDFLLQIWYQSGNLLLSVLHEMFLLVGDVILMIQGVLNAAVYLCQLLVREKETCFLTIPQRIAKSSLAAS
jgi:hypothetical protein